MKSLAATVFIATGAFSVGKSTTLRWLHDHHDLRVHAEAHPQVVASLGDCSRGHPPDQAFRQIDDAEHFCPLCRPREFCGRVIDLQQSIERGSCSGDMLERGVFDPIEFYLRHAGAPASAIEPGKAGSELIDPRWQPVATYSKVFLFEVMPAVQLPKWGKSAAERIAEAYLIEERLERSYATRGYNLIRVPPGTVSERARLILDHIR